MKKTKSVSKGMKKMRCVSQGIEFANVEDKPHDLPISQMAVAGDFMYTWGYGELFDLKNPKPGMRKVFEHVKKLLASKGLTFANVVKVTALLAPVECFGEYSALYRTYFKAPYPCRTTIPTPSDKAFLEIDVVAYKKGLSD